jgi:enoyl-CoA hydratase
MCEIVAQRAYEIGFVNHVVPPDQLMPRALQLEHTIARNAPLSVRCAKEIISLATESGKTPARRTAEHVFDRVYRSKDAQEGPKAFLENRAPNWTGE